MEIIKNKLMKILLSIAMIISALGLGLVLMPGVAAAAEVTPDGTYTSNDGYYLYTVTDGKAQITKYSAGTETTPLTIPSTLTVTVMGVETTSIVTGLAEKSFSGKYASVTIPEGIVSIGLVPFYSCSSLTSIQVDVNNVNYSSIGGLLYDKAGTTLIECPRSITSVSIPENVTRIGDSAFQGCSKLTGITLPSSVTSIGDSAFRSCSKLTSITLPQSVTSIGERAFQSCSKLTGITLPQSVTIIGDSTFNCCYALTSITLSQSVTSIGSNAFESCFALTGITLPQSITSIGPYAFSHCEALTSITLPQSVTSIGDCAFSSCLFLTGIQVDVNNLNYKSIDGVLYNSAGTTLVACPAGLTGAFTVLEGVTGIGFGAFEGCWNLTGITLPSSVTSIGDEAFYRCESATSINIPQGVISIGKYGFYMCSNLTSISLPASVTSIAGDTFQLCTNVTTLTVDHANAEYKSINNLLLNKAGTCLIWGSGGLTSVDIPQGVTSIGDYAFCYNTPLTSVTIPEGVTSIGDYAFSMTNITSISIPEGVTSIGDSAFSLTKLTGSLSIPQSVTSIGYFAFSNSQSAVTSVTFNSATTIIYDDENTIPATAKIIGYNPSTAKDYATKYGRTFEVLTIKTVTGVTTLSAINVANGTTLVNAGLPSTVQATFSDASTQAIDVTWDGGSPAYNANTAGTYTFRGTLANLPTGVTNPNSVTATVNVIVAPDDNKPNYTVGIGTLSGGSITASPTTATADTTIELTITPDTGRRLQAGSLKYNDGTDHTITGTSFTMPAANVTVTAVFEQISALALTAGTVTAAPGAVINVPINLTSSGEVVALGFELSYDHSLLTYNQTSLGSGAAGFTIFDFISGNNEAVNLYNMTNTPFPGGTDSTIATMRFTVANAASPGAACVLGLNGVVLSDAQGNEITAKTVNNGQFSIPGQEKTVIGVTTLSAITVANGTELANAGLPSTVQAILSDTSTQAIDVIWDGGTPAYSAITAGTYTFSGTLANLPTSVTNPANVTANVDVVVAPGAGVVLTGIVITTPATKLTYAAGDPLDLSGLVVTGTYSDNSTQEVTVTEANVTGFNSTVIATDQVLTINVDGKTATYTVQIVEATGATDYTYTVTNGQAQITGYTGAGGDIVIPSSLDGVPVTSIGDNAFYSCTGITSISLPSTLTSIGAYAFKGCKYLVSMNIPQNITSIGEGAFYNCYVLEGHITIPEGTTDITKTFMGCKKLSGISLPSTLTSIGNSAIRGCMSLESIIIPQGVTSIGDSAFYEDNALTSINLPEGLLTIGLGAFMGCGLTSISIPQSVTSVGQNAFQGGITSGSNLSTITFISATTTIFDTEYTIPAATTIIGFAGSTAQAYATKYSRTFEVLTIKTVTGVTTLSAINVANGTELANAGLPSTVQAILSDNSIQAIDVTWDGGTPAYNAITAGTYTFSGTLANLPTGVTNPNSVTATVNVIVAPDDNKPNYTVGIGTLSGGSITASPTTATADTTIELTVTPDTGRQLQAGSLKYNDGTDHVITGTSFTMPAANVTVTALFEQIPASTPVYTVSPVADPAYALGITDDGINKMTVNAGISGFKYFAVNITPVISHSGLEAVVFTHLRNGVQLSINVTKADFDLVNSAQAGFNVQQGDVVKVYIVDDLTNAVDNNPVILQ